MGTEANAAMSTPEPISEDERRLRLENLEFDEPAFLRALDDAVTAFDEAGVDFLFMGGIASACQGRPRFTHDIDVFVRTTGA